MDYKALKDLIKESVAELERDETSRLSFSPRTTSLTVQRADRGSRNSEENFFERLEREVILQHTLATDACIAPLTPLGACDCCADMC